MRWLCKLIGHKWEPWECNLGGMLWAGRKCSRCDWVNARIERLPTNLGELDELRLRQALDQASAKIKADGGHLEWSIYDVGEGDQLCEF